MVAALAGLSSFAAAPLLGACLLVGLGRPRWLVAVPGALLAVHLAWLAPSLVPDPQPAARPGTDLTVLTLNVEFGGADPARVVRAVREQRVDVLVLVELTGDAVTRLRAAGLERDLPYRAVRAGPTSSGAGIWSREPLTDLGDVPGTIWSTPAVRVASAGGEVTVVAVHLTPPQFDGGPSWRADSRAVATWLEQRRRADGAGGSAGERLVVAGDFNAGLEHAPLRTVLAAGVSDAVDVVGLRAWPGLTWPADGRILPPLLRIDHVLVSPATVVVRDVGTLAVPGTDHRAVLARLALA